MGMPCLLRSALATAVDAVRKAHIILRMYEYDFENLAALFVKIDRVAHENAN